MLVENLANTETTRTPKGGPYRRKDAVFESTTVSSPFSSVFNAQFQPPGGVAVSEIVTDSAHKLWVVLAETRFPVGICQAADRNVTVGAEEILVLVPAVMMHVNELPAQRLRTLREHSAQNFQTQPLQLRLR